MITVQLKTTEKSGSVMFSGNEVLEPCEIIVTGDYSLKDIQAMFWLMTLTAEGTGQGIYPLIDNVCPPSEFISVMTLSAVEVVGIPDDWQSDLDALLDEEAERSEDGQQC
ncbi:hypothetical protein [Pantoea sp. CCBC3-3-1]|uniref:hypothetical protein n=1 Tax=Pantoea sp. CCBC3-3-1 TaxID=2490851 RepID=UPI0011BD8EDC|nr:hypothetical protein [Pantoea sp. CCBC3-3-1]